MINVTKTYLPDIEKYKKYIDKTYESGWVTNNGPLVQELEAKLAVMRSYFFSYIGYWQLISAVGAFVIYVVASMLKGRPKEFRNRIFVSYHKI